MLDVTVAAAPHRDRKSLRRGVFHNSKRLDDGTWTWRYDSFRKGDGFQGLWDDVRDIPCRPHWCAAPTRTSSTTRTPPQFARTAPRDSATTCRDSGHSVQGDQPRELIDILRQVLHRPA